MRLLIAFVSIMIMAVCALSLFTSAANAYQSGDFQIWNTNTQEIKIGKATKFVMEEEYRYGETATELFYQHYDFGVAWAFDKRFEIAFGDRYILEKYKHKFRQEDDVFTNLTWRQDVWKFKFEDRNRIEYRNFHYPKVPNDIRYRNRFGVKYPIEFKTIKIVPHVSDEIFVISTGRGFVQNRFQVGLEFELTKYVKFDVSYMQQQVKKLDEKWFKANVLWLKERISF
jgi:hypothetical protein